MTAFCGLEDKWMNDCDYLDADESLISYSDVQGHFAAFNFGCRM